MKAFCVVSGHNLHTGFVSEAEKSEALNLDALTLFELEGRVLCLTVPKNLII